MFSDITIRTQSFFIYLFVLLRNPNSIQESLYFHLKREKKRNISKGDLLNKIFFFF